MGSGRPRGRLNGVDVKSDVLRHARERAGLSLAQVAGAELTRQAVHLIETGKVRPSMNSLRVITSRLSVPIDTVLMHPVPRVQAAVEEVEALVQTHHYGRALERGEEILLHIEAPLAVAITQYQLGHALCKLGRPMEALERLKSARDLSEALGDDELIADTMDMQARALHLAEQPGALAVAEEALERYRRVSRPRPETESRLLERLGTILAGQKDFTAARRRYDEALDVAGGVRDLARIARIYHGLHLCYLAVGDLDRAIDLTLKAETLYEAEQRVNQSPPNVDLPRVENDLGVLLVRTGDFSRAEQRFESALRHLEEMGVERLRSHVLLSLGELRHKQGRYEAGVELAERAIQLAERFNERRALATGLTQLGEAQAALGRSDEAIASLKKALVVLEEAGLDERRAECLRTYERVIAQRQIGATAEQAG